MILSAQHISKSVGDFSLQDIQLDIREGSYVVILGKSGSGKSLLLELMAGLKQADTGSFVSSNAELFEKGKIGLLFQDYALFPHLTVQQNISFPLKMKKVGKREQKDICKEIAEKLSIDHLLSRNIQALSGGEKQRVALARILAMKPELILLDEPLSSLDSNLRQDLRSLLRKINREGISIVHVTHDYEEALAMAQHIVVMDEGRIIQQGGPVEVFKNPRNAFVAGFTGMKNFYKARVLDSSYVQVFGEHKLHSSHIPEGAAEGYIMVPQEEIILSHNKPDSSANNCMQGEIKEIILNHYGYELQIDTGMMFSVYITAASLERLGMNLGQQIYLSFKSSAVRFIEH